MSIVRVDSFDHYDSIPVKWDTGSAQFTTNASFVRTGGQAILLPGTAFPALPKLNFTNRTTMIAGLAIHPAILAEVRLFSWFNNGVNDGQVGLWMESDGSLLVVTGNVNDVLGQTAPSLITAGVYNYVEIKAKMIAGAPTGSIEVRVNGQTALLKTGIPTTRFANGADQFILQGSQLVDVYADDFYLLDDQGTANNDFLGAVRIYAIMPDANETPLDWVPLANQNYQEVNQIPPPGDTAYVESDTVGATDQYHYTPSGPTGAYEIKGIQHSLDAKLSAAGSHSICSQINTHSGGQVALGSDYHMVVTPWDVNPNTGAAFVPADFATTFVGPKITL